MAVVCLGAVGIALVSQHVFGMEPCPWCVLERLIFLAIAAVAALGSALRAPVTRGTCAGTMLALSVAGVAAAAWQHVRAAASGSCNLTFADRLLSALRLDTALPSVFEPRASCADAAVDLLGVAYDLWSLALYVGVAAASLLLLRRQLVPKG